MGLFPSDNKDPPSTRWRASRRESPSFERKLTRLIETEAQNGVYITIEARNATPKECRMRRLMFCAHNFQVTHAPLIVVFVPSTIPRLPRETILVRIGRDLGVASSAVRHDTPHLVEHRLPRCRIGKQALNARKPHPRRLCRRDAVNRGGDPPVHASKSKRIKSRDRVALDTVTQRRSEEHTSELQSQFHLV